jgi:predicted amidohydrolase YtcJ
MRRHDFDRLILHNGTVHTLDDADRVVDAVGFAGGRVTAAGSFTDVRAATPNADERDLGGRAVYPGFIDAHHHLCFAATYANFPAVRCPPLRRVEQLLAAVAAYAAHTPEGQWIVLIGYNDAALDEHRAPSRFELDRAAPLHPVLLVHFTFHEGVLNSLGLARAGLDTDDADQPGGWRGRTPAGQLDGRVYERCFGHAEAAARNALLATSSDGWFAAANAYQDRVLAAGITHVCDAAVPPSLEALYREWQARGELVLGITMMPLIENMFAEPVTRLHGPASGWEDRRLSIGALKLFADGGIDCGLCITLREAIVQFGVLLGRMLRDRSLLPWRFARRQTSRLGPDHRLHLGLLYYSSAQLDALVRAAAEHGFGVAIHAAGDEAVAIAVNVLERAPRGPLPPRIDHFFFVDAPVLRRAVDSGIHVVVQPRQLHDTGDWLRQTGLPGRLAYQGFAQMLDAGARLAGSSDAPVVDFSVLAAIETAASRRLASGATLTPEQRITPAQAVRMYTRGAAAALGMEGRIGQLRPGARADAVVLSEALDRVPSERLAEVGLVSTLAGQIELNGA